jgi:23S rRNA (adenine2503-C2)-methyltransferase
MKVLSRVGRDDIANVYIADYGNNRMIEFVESIEPPIPREKKWVIIISTSFGCPVKCPICDASSFFAGHLTKPQIMSQIDYLVNLRYPNQKIPAEKFKIQFARMGEPSFNSNVLAVLEELPERFDAPGLIPCISTVAPQKRENFFEKLLDIRKIIYGHIDFQLQFSIHTTDIILRDKLIPIRKWDFKNIADYGERFIISGKRKITLNFALADNSPLDPDVISHFFDPKLFLIKITPINPTSKAIQNRYRSYIRFQTQDSDYEIVETLRSIGYEVIISIGELEENKIGSNCGQYISDIMMNNWVVEGAYSYKAKGL